jgi:hypothetical protein
MDQGTSFVSKEVGDLLVTTVLSCSIHLHILLKLTIKVILAIKL